jgi:hypothetical protein
LPRFARWLAGAAIACALAPVALAGDDMPGPGEGDPAGDMLLFVPPPGWQPAHQEKGEGAYRIVYLPEGQTLADWSESLDGQIFFNLTKRRPELSPADFTENLAAHYAQACEGGGASPVSTFEERGYRAAVRMVSCARKRGESLGSVSMVKVMRGKASLFMVERVWRGPAFASEEMPVPQTTLDGWADFLAQARLCNDDNPLSPCPEGAQ